MKVKLLAAFAAGIFMIGTASAQSGEPMYSITFYSDASQATVVGTGTPSCGPNGVTYEFEGEQTQFRRDDLFATCGPDGPQFIQ